MKRGKPGLMSMGMNATGASSTPLATSIEQKKTLSVSSNTLVNLIPKQRRISLKFMGPTETSISAMAEKQQQAGQPIHPKIWTRDSMWWRTSEVQVILIHEENMRSKRQQDALSSMTDWLTHAGGYYPVTTMQLRTAEQRRKSRHPWTTLTPLKMTCLWAGWGSSAQRARRKVRATVEAQNMLKPPNRSKLEVRFIVIKYIYD